MNLYRLIALVLVSWYLLVPMFDPKSGRAISLPLSDWNEEGIFDSLKECESAKAKLTQEYQRHGASRGILNIVGGQSQCVASDDPRLNGKVPYSLGPIAPEGAARDSSQSKGN